MDNLPFEPDIANAASKTGTPKILKVDFGDGYTQRSDNGINSCNEEWSKLSWSKNISDAIILETFLRAHGANPFAWTPPGESAQYFIVKSWTSTPIGSLAKKLTATFEKVYDLI